MFNYHSVKKKEQAVTDRRVLKDKLDHLEQSRTQRVDALADGYFNRVQKWMNAQEQAIDLQTRHLTQKLHPTDKRQNEYDEEELRTTMVREYAPLLGAQEAVAKMGFRDRKRHKELAGPSMSSNTYIPEKQRVQETVERHRWLRSQGPWKPIHLKQHLRQRMRELELGDHDIRFKYYNDKDRVNDAISKHKVIADVSEWEERVPEGFKSTESVKRKGDTRKKFYTGVYRPGYFHPLGHEGGLASDRSARLLTETYMSAESPYRSRKNIFQTKRHRVTEGVGAQKPIFKVTFRYQPSNPTVHQKGSLTARDRQRTSKKPKTYWTEVADVATKRPVPKAVDATVDGDDTADRPVTRSDAQENITKFKLQLQEFPFERAAENEARYGVGGQHSTTFDDDNDSFDGEGRDVSDTPSSSPMRELRKPANVEKAKRLYFAHAPPISARLISKRIHALNKTRNPARSFRLKQSRDARGRRTVTPAMLKAMRAPKTVNAQASMPPKRHGSRRDLRFEFEGGGFSARKPAAFHHYYTGED